LSRQTGIERPFCFIPITFRPMWCLPVSRGQSKGIEKVAHHSKRPERVRENFPN
jgi:hypothetical protein